MAMLSSYAVKIRHCRWRKRQKTKRVKGGVRIRDREEDRNADGRKPQRRDEEKADIG